MMNILDTIIARKKVEVEASRSLNPVSALEKSGWYDRETLSLTEFIRKSGRTGIIAEFKRKSPSKGVINDRVSVEDVTTRYYSAGASALSVLTDREFFGGSNDDLISARRANSCPILRKDFTIDEYQIIEAKAIGADAILLIAAVMDRETSRRLTKFAHELSLEVLLEVHDLQELENHAQSGADLIGVNNRNLKSFEVDLSISKRLAPLIPDGVVKVSESGISSPESIVELRQFGFEGFLIGENFMKEQDPGTAAKIFMDQLKAPK